MFTTKVINCSLKYLPTHLLKDLQLCDFLKERISHWNWCGFSRNIQNTSFYLHAHFHH